MSCSILHSRIEGGASNVPQHVFDDIMKFREKKEETRKKHKLDEMSEPDSKKVQKLQYIVCNKKKLEQTPFPYFPCSQCLRPCKTWSSYQDHLSQQHGIVLIDEEDQ